MSRSKTKVKAAKAKQDSKRRKSQSLVSKGKNVMVNGKPLLVDDVSSIPNPVCDDTLHTEAQSLFHSILNDTGSAVKPIKAQNIFKKG